MNRPFEGGFVATLGIFMVIYCHMLIPWNFTKCISLYTTISTRQTYTSKSGLALTSTHMNSKKREFISDEWGLNPLQIYVND